MSLGYILIVIYLIVINLIVIYNRLYININYIIYIIDFIQIWTDWVHFAHMKQVLLWDFDDRQY